MPTIKGFKFQDGKFSEDTLRQMREQGDNPGLDRMFGVGHKIDKK